MGLSPLIRDYLNLYPTGNDPTSGDGLNTIGLRAPADSSSRSDTGLFRLDHNFTDNWRFAGSFIYQRQRSNTIGQLEIDRNLAGVGCKPLKAHRATRATLRCRSRDNSHRR